MTGKPQSLVFAAVHYHHSEAIPDLDSSLQSQSDTGWALLIADNGSTELERLALAELEACDLRIKIVGSGTNLGYLGGVRVAREAAADYGLGEPRWFIVCNQDIVLDQGFVETLRGLALPPSAAVVAPKVIARPSGRPMNPYMRSRPSLGRTLLRTMAFSTMSGMRVAANRSDQRRRTPTRDKLEACRIYAPHGSLIAFNKVFFESGGHLRWSAFMFGEEIFIGDQVRRLNLEIWFVPKLGADHNEHSTTGNLKDNNMLRLKRKGALTASRLLIFHR